MIGVLTNTDMSNIAKIKPVLLEVIVSYLREI